MRYIYIVLMAMFITTLSGTGCHVEDPEVFETVEGLEVIEGSEAPEPFDEEFWDQGSAQGTSPVSTESPEKGEGYSLECNNNYCKRKCGPWGGRYLGAAACACCAIP